MISRSNDYFTACYTVLMRPNKVETAATVAILGFEFGLYHVVVPLSFQHHCFLVFLFLADQIFYRSYVNRQHFRLQSFASLFQGVLQFNGNFILSMLKITHYTVTVRLLLSILETNTKAYEDEVPECLPPFLFGQGESSQFPLKLPVVIVNSNADYVSNFRRDGSPEMYVRVSKATDKKTRGVYRRKREQSQSPKSNYICDNVPTKAILFFFDSRTSPSLVWYILIMIILVMIIL